MDRVYFNSSIPLITSKSTCIVFTYVVHVMILKFNINNIFIYLNVCNTKLVIIST